MKTVSVRENETKQAKKGSRSHAVYILFKMA